MIKHNFKVSLRQLMKNKVYSSINIGGLALGMTVAMLIGLWVTDELTYNKNHDNYNSIVQVLRNDSWNGEISTNNSLTTGMGTLLSENFRNHFEQVAMVRARIEQRTLSHDDKKFTQQGYFMQPEGPEMFSLPMKYGSRDGLKELRSIMLSESLSKKLFGDTNPVNEVVRMNAEWDLKVTGVYEDLPKNSEFKAASYFSTIDFYLEGWASLNSWNNSNMYVYGKLNPESNIDEVSSLIDDAFKERLEASEEDNNLLFFLNPMTEWHLNSEFVDGKRVTSKTTLFVWFYGAIGAFVLVLACINFMNLSTARSEKRAKEVGIRKTVGSLRSQLIAQFYVEALLYSFLAFGLSLLLLKASLPWFNQTSGKGISQPWDNGSFWLLAIGFMLVTALLAGSYPAAYLSSFRPIKALKGTFAAGKRAAIPRKVLVVFQFTISIVLIIGTITVNNQIQFAKNRPVGYSPEGMISLRPASPEFNKKLPVLKDELARTGFVDAVGTSNYAVTSTLGWNGGFQWDDENPNTTNISFNTINISYDYAEAVGMEFIAGRNFSREFPTDQNGVLINRSAMERMQLQDPVGKVLSYNPSWKELDQYTVLGVVEDMIKGSPFESTNQSVMFLGKRFSWLYIRIAQHASLSEAIPVIEAKFNEVYPDAPFDFQFADEEYAKKFEAEERISSLAKFFSVLAIIISSLGLFGLASYVAEQRTKEIGIRKVLGASVSNLWSLLSKDFTLLVILSCVIAVPIAYSVLSGWLSGYEEIRTPMYWWVFAVAGAGALLITVVTVSFQAIKAAVANPVKSLRSE